MLTMMMGGGGAPSSSPIGTAYVTVDLSGMTLLGLFGYGSTGAVLIYKDGATLYARVLTASPLAAGSAITITHPLSALPTSVVKLSDTLFVFYDGTTAAAASFNGSAFTFGSAVTVNAATTVATMCRLSSSRVFFGYLNGAAAGFRAASVSGTTITQGTALSVSAATASVSGNVYRNWVGYAADNKIFVYFIGSSSGTTFAHLTVDGSLNTTLGTVSSTSLALDDNYASFAEPDSSGYLYIGGRQILAQVNVSGTTPAWSKTWTYSGQGNASSVPSGVCAIPVSTAKVYPMMGPTEVVTGDVLPTLDYSGTAPAIVLWSRVDRPGVYSGSWHSALCKITNTLGMGLFGGMTSTARLRLIDLTF